MYITCSFYPFVSYLRYDTWLITLTVSVITFLSGLLKNDGYGYSYGYDLRDYCGEFTLATTCRKGGDISVVKLKMAIVAFIKVKGENSMELNNYKLQEIKFSLVFKSASLNPRIWNLFKIS